MTPEEVEAKVDEYVEKYSIPRREARRLVQNELAE